MKKVRIGVTGINPFNGNRGVGALAYSTFYLLDKISQKNDGKFEILVFQSNEGKCSFQIGDAVFEVRDVFQVSLFSLKEIVKLFTNPQRIKALLFYFRLDYVLCMGQGDSFSDIYGKQRFLSTNGHHRMARLLRKKYLLLPQTIGPFKDPKVKKAAVKSINKAEAVFARDRQSYDYVQENSKQKKVFESIDVAFFMPYKKIVFKEGYTHVGLNVSALLWNGGYTRDNQFNLKCDYQSTIRNIIDYFSSMPDVKLHLVPHVVLLNSHVENDYEVCYNLAQEYGDEVVLAPFFLDPIKAKSYIAGLDFFMGARMHSTIAAYSSCVPVVPMAYSRKFNGLFKDTLKYPYMVDMVNEEPDVALEHIKLAFEERGEMLSMVQEGMDHVLGEKYTSLLTALESFLG